LEKFRKLHHVHSPVVSGNVAEHLTARLDGRALLALPQLGFTDARRLAHALNDPL
jgi:hypothetical protein